MRETLITVTNTIKADYFKGTCHYYLTEPHLPDGCEKCSAYKGSSFELRLMYLICNDSVDSGGPEFLCESCYVETVTQELKSLGQKG